MLNHKQEQRLLMKISSKIIIFLSLLVFASTGCTDTGRRPDNPIPLLRAWPDGVPSILVRLAESGSSPGQRKDCNETVKRLGIPNDDPEPEIDVLIDVTETSGDIKTYKISARNPHYVRIETRPAWLVSDLCSDALAAGLRLLMKTKGMNQISGLADGERDMDSHHPDDPNDILASWMGPPAVVNIKLSINASPRQRGVCESVIGQYGVRTRLNAPVIAIIGVGEPNKLKVVSRNRGLIVEGTRPDWPMAQLCKDALAQALKAFRNEFGQQMGRSTVPSRL